MVRLTDQHWRASRARAEGLTYADIAQQERCSVDQARTLVGEWCKVARPQLNAEQPDPEGGDGGSSDGG